MHTLYRRPDAPATPAPAFDPGHPVDPESIDELTGAVPTWRLDEQPVYDGLLTEWPALYARLCQPLDDPGEDVVEGVVLPPTQPIDLPPPTVVLPEVLPALPVTGKGGRDRRAPRKRVPA